MMVVIAHSLLEVAEPAVSAGVEITNCGGGRVPRVRGASTRALPIDDANFMNQP